MSETFERVASFLRRRDEAVRGATSDELSRLVELVGELPPVYREFAERFGACEGDPLGLWPGGADYRVARAIEAYEASTEPYPEGTIWFFDRRAMPAVCLKDHGAAGWAVVVPPEADGDLQLLHPSVHDFVADAVFHRYEIARKPFRALLRSTVDLREPAGIGPAAPHLGLAPCEELGEASWRYVSERVAVLEQRHSPESAPQVHLGAEDLQDLMHGVAVIEDLTPFEYVPGSSA